MSSLDMPQSSFFENEWEGATSEKATAENGLHFSDSEDEEAEDEEHVGDYSQRMEELFEDGEVRSQDVQDEEDEEEGFFYTGVDAPDISLTYHEQLRDVLDQDNDGDDSFEAREVESSLLLEGSHNLPLPEDDPLHVFRREFLSDHSPSASSLGPMTPPSRMGSPAMLGQYQKLARPFLNPTISRLRSYTPQGASHLSHNEGTTTSHSHLFDGASPSPSRFSSMSRSSSISNLHLYSSNGRSDSQNGKLLPPQREVFGWSDLHTITQELYSRRPQKALSLLGGSSLSAPTVLAANGFICIGLEDGRICIYDFKQNLKAVCGDESTGSTVGPVTALALSHDHTCIASGHTTGHIQLFDLKKPQSPLRTVPPTSMAVVTTGRKEGHLNGSRIVSVGFIAGRHTALVSADEHGLAFYHSLGKMLFVEASDILRILGRYPDPDSNYLQSLLPLTTATTPGFSPLPRKRKVRYTVLAMGPLPLGTTPHPTDAYDVVALLTPSKLVVVGLRPTPKTWFKCPRELEEGGVSRSQWKGTMAWFPSVSRLPGNSATTQAGTLKQPLARDSDSTNPVLAYTWGNSLRLIKVMESRFKQRVQSSKTGKTSDINVGTIVYETAGKWTAEDDILSIQWLNVNQLVVVTTTNMGIYDTLTSKLIEKTQFDGPSLMSPTLSRTVNGSAPYADSVTDVSHSLRVYKGKIFLLGRDRLIVGTLLTWADRILALVQAGDFLSAIDLTRTYYTGEAPGNRNGLPDDPDQRKDVIGDKMRNLMDASVRYAFSEARMTDGTHVTADGRGVDRTSLFEGLVTTCCRACVALNDFEFLFEDLFQQYDDSGISGIYLRQLEPFILKNEVRFVPPRITQRLVALHEEDGKPEYVERIIWHMDPSCLDLNQTIHLCQKFHLYDALIYIYTRAMQDYVAPIVELLGLIRRVQQYRKSSTESREESGIVDDVDSEMEPVIINAYKIYPYLANVLSGLSYPSEERLPEEEAYKAKNDVYNFLFFGRSSVWPPGNEGKLVLTADEEGGMEPTYPYARQLLRFDSESFLHTLDIAFEDAYLNDESQSVNRIIIVLILLEILSGGQLSSEDITFVNIFIARNVPKYPQFLQIAPTVLHKILISLAEDPDPRTQEDRQLAAEYLLSVYNPHDSDSIVSLFEQAGFYRILRSWYRQDRRWSPLLSTYLRDPRLHTSEIFDNVNEVISLSSRANRGSVPTNVIETVSKSLPRLLQVSIGNTASLVDHYFSNLHEDALDVLMTGLDNGDDNYRACYLYLRQLIVPSTGDPDESFTPGWTSAPSERLSLRLRQKFIELQSRLHPESVIGILRQIPEGILDWTQVLQTCEENEAYDAVVWTLNWKGEPQHALKKAEQFQHSLTQRITKSILKSKSILQPDLHGELELLKAIGLTGRDICLQHSQAFSAMDVPLEDLWFSLLSSQIHSIQVVAACSPVETGENSNATLSILRSMVQTTFSALVSVTSTQAVSFPRLFKRLVNSTPTSTGTHYTEFRIILGGMLESYRSDGDMLAMTKNLIDCDLFEKIAEITAERNRGWAPSLGVCSVCRKPLMSKSLQSDPSSPTTPQDIPSHQIVVSRTGTISHRSCLA